MLWLDRNLTGRDVVLLENDLPDLLEQKPLVYDPGRTQSKMPPSSVGWT